MLTVEITFTPQLCLHPPYVGQECSVVTEMPGKLEVSMSRDVGGRTVVILKHDSGNQTQRATATLPEPTHLKPINGVYHLPRDCCLYVRHFAIEREVVRKTRRVDRTTLAGQTQLFPYSLAQLGSSSSASPITTTLKMIDTSSGISKGSITLTFSRRIFDTPSKFAFEDHLSPYEMYTTKGQQRYQHMVEYYHKLSRIVLDRFGQLNNHAANVRIPPYSVNGLAHVPGLFALALPSEPTSVGYWKHLLRIGVTRQFPAFADYRSARSYLFEYATDQELLEIGCQMASVFTSLMSYMADFVMNPQNDEQVMCERFEVCLRRKTIGMLAVGCDCEDMSWSILSVLWELQHLTDQQCLSDNNDDNSEDDDGEDGKLLLDIVRVLRHQEFLMTLKSVTSAAFSGSSSSSSDKAPVNPLDRNQGGHMDVTIVESKEVARYERRFYGNHRPWKMQPIVSQSPCLISSSSSSSGIGNVGCRSNTCKTRSQFGEGTEWVHPDGSSVGGIGSMSDERLAIVVGIDQRLADTLREIRETLSVDFRGSIMKTAEKSVRVYGRYRHEHVIDRDKPNRPFYCQAISFFWPRPCRDAGVPVLGGYFLTRQGNDNDDSFVVGSSVYELLKGASKNSIAIVYDPPMTNDEINQTIYCMKYIPEVPPFSVSRDLRRSLSKSYCQLRDSVESKLKHLQKRLPSQNCYMINSSDNERRILKGNYVAVDAVVRYDELLMEGKEFYELLEADLADHHVVTFEYAEEMVHIDDVELCPIGGYRIRLILDKSAFKNQKLL